MTERLRRVFLRWEWLLVVMTIAVYLFFHARIGGSYTVLNLINQTRVYMVDVGFLALGILLILILGDMDISIASTAALSCTVMAVSYNAGNGIPFGAALALGVGVGAVCGLVNGLLVTRFKELFPMIITLATSTLYRGVAYIILKDQSAGSFPSWFSSRLGYGSVPVFGVNVPVMLLCFLAVLPLFYVWLHHTTSGRRIFAAGTNLQATRYSGVKTDSIKLTLFTLAGVMAAIGGMFLSARTGSVKYTIGTGYEMQAIAIAILAGASTAGGKGSVIGVLLSLMLMTCLKNGLMLLYNDDFILKLAVGALLILIVLVPNVAGMLKSRGQIRKRRLASISVSNGQSPVEK